LSAEEKNLSHEARKNITLADLEQQRVWKSWEAQKIAEYEALPEPRRPYGDWTAAERHGLHVRRARIVLEATKKEYVAAAWEHTEVRRVMMEAIQEVVYSLQLSALDREALEIEFATPLLLEPADPHVATRPCTRLEVALKTPLEAARGAEVMSGEQIPGSSTSDSAHADARQRQAWMDGQHPGWSLGDWAGHSGLAFKTVQKYWEGITTNRTRYVRQRIAEAEKLGFPAIPE
jgi:hypothetical protein